ncbi:hypothetical protein ACSTS3_10660 [Aquimarina muelleri]|uniref:hypothetical protein n=1 Tax=Aquimarina muelleri TaxID=279356 RepID=UPI003F684B92
MITRYKTVIFLLIGLTSCAQQSKLSSIEEISKIPKEKQITYSIHINAKTPFEIFIDDIPLERFYESGMNVTVELNPYLLSNGTHKLKVRYLPREDSKDSLVHPSDVYHTKDAKWNIFFVRYIKNGEEPLGYEGEIDYGNSELEVVPPPKPVPVWEQEFDIDIKDLPYNLKGWSESQDLSKMDEYQLQKKVFEYFNYLRNLLNEGEIDTFLELNKTKDFEIGKATYETDLDWFSSPERTENIKNKCKGNMLPINENEYKMKFFANGKIVTLERIDRFKNMGLVAKRETDSKVRYSIYNFLLHKPVGSDTFEIIRK